MKSKVHSNQTIDGSPVDQPDHPVFLPLDTADPTGRYEIAPVDPTQSLRLGARGDRRQVPAVIGSRSGPFLRLRSRAQRSDRGTKRARFAPSLVGAIVGSLHSPRERCGRRDHEWRRSRIDTTETLWLYSAPWTPVGRGTITELTRCLSVLFSRVTSPAAERTAFGPVCRPRAVGRLSSAADKRAAVI